MSGDKTMLAAAYQDASNNLIALRSAMRNTTAAINGLLYAVAVSLFQFCALIKAFPIIMFSLIITLCLFILLFHTFTMYQLHKGIIKFRYDLAKIYHSSQEKILLSRDLSTSYQRMISEIMSNLRKISEKQDNDLKFISHKKFMKYLLDKSGDLKISHALVIINIVPIVGIFSIASLCAQIDIFPLNAVRIESQDIIANMKISQERVGFLKKIPFIIIFPLSVCLCLVRIHDYFLCKFMLNLIIEREMNDMPCMLREKTYSALRYFPRYTPTDCKKCFEKKCVLDIIVNQTQTPAARRGP